MEEHVDEIMERLRMRRNQLSSEMKENEESGRSFFSKLDSVDRQSTSVFGSSRVNIGNGNESLDRSDSLTSSKNSFNYDLIKTDERKNDCLPSENNGSNLSTKDRKPEEVVLNFAPAPKNESSPEKAGELPPADKTSARKARFSALAQEHEEFECDFTSHYNKPKEAYMKGKSPRMSIGETRPSVLCTPAGALSLRSSSNSTSGLGIQRGVTSHAEKEKNSSKSDSSLKKIDENGVESLEDRRIKFAQPLVNVNYLPNESASGSSVNDTISTVLGGCSEMMNVTTSSLSCDDTSLMDKHLTMENTIVNSQTCENREAILRERERAQKEAMNLSSDYGAHTFMKKRSCRPAPTLTEDETIEFIDNAASTSTSTGTTTTSTTTRTTRIVTTTSSPKPFRPGCTQLKHSPVQFIPMSTSSPILTHFKESKQPGEEEEENKRIPSDSGLAETSPAKSAAIENSIAKTLREQFEKKMEIAPHAPAPIPVPRQNVSTNVVAQQRALFTPNKNANVTPSPNKPTLPSGVQTQWRGTHNTPVVQGARADEKTATDVVGPGQSKIKSLRSRWEFSSATGTPIHPDASEDSLIAAAIKMKESARKASRQINNSTRSLTASPASKTVRYEKEEPVEEEVEDDEVEEAEEGDDAADDNDDVFLENDEDLDEEINQRHEQSAIEEEESADELASTDASRIIDQAFDFMERGGSSCKVSEHTPSPCRYNMAPMAASEDFASPRRSDDVIEEEDVPMGEEDDEISQETKSDRSKNDSKLPYSVSFYRKIQREHVAGDKGTPIKMVVEPSAPEMLSSPMILKKLTCGDTNNRDVGAMLERLRQAVKVENEHISQSRRALGLCRDSTTFRGSREEIEMQRALLIAIERQRALMSELSRLEKHGPWIVDGPRGDVQITQLQVNLSKDIVNSSGLSSQRTPDLYYFVALLKWGEQVEVSKLVTSDMALNRKGVLEFSMPLKLSSLPPDFKACLEIYGQRAPRENFSHEDKYKLKGSTFKTKSKNSGTLSNNTSMFGMSMKQSMYEENVDSKFSMLGAMTFDIKTPSKKVYTMNHHVHPLDGVILMKVKKRAVEGVELTHRGFLSMYQRTGEGLGSWTRYWCLLDGGEMKFWRHPEDETNKQWIVLLDLATCTKTEGASAVVDICPYPNSFHIDVWVPKEEAACRKDSTLSSSNDIEQLRVMMAADTPTELQSWLSVINSSSRQLCTWRNPIF